MNLSIRVLQLQLHLVARNKAQGLIQWAPFVARMQDHNINSIFAAPFNSSLREPTP
jgi:hypothetical protein